jgi:hypothetical protein
MFFTLVKKLSKLGSQAKPIKLAFEFGAGLIPNLAS